MAEQPGLEFAGVLRRLRTEAGLTQEELAEAAGLSPRSVSDLERGIHRTARKDTAVLLADALGLAEPPRALFVAAARGRALAAEVLAVVRGEAPGAAAAATRTLPRDIANFTGRERELAWLLEAVIPTAADGGMVGIHAIDGMAGVGKTTFAVHAAHRLAPDFPDGQFFLPLHAHTPGQRPVPGDPADALGSLLLTAGLAPQQIPPGAEARAARWRGQVAGKKILLLLDDAASHRQVRPLLPGTAGSLVLVTSRRRLTALQDAAVVSLDVLPPVEAAALLARLAARPGVRASDAAVGELTRLCGYLPLAIGMLASQLRHHLAWSPAELAADVAAARDRLALMHAEDVSVGAAFALSYTDLTAAQQRLFRRLGLLPGPGIDAYAAAALDGTTLDAARRGLEGLYDQHLLTEPAPGRYQLHDLLREHARALAAADNPAESDAATGRLLDYYLHTALAAGRHFASPPAARRRPPGRPPAQAPDVSALGQAASWLDAERANLHAAVEYCADRARSRHAIAIPAAMSGFLTARGYWDQSAALHQSALIAARQAGDRLGEADTLTELGVLQAETGGYPAAAATLTRAVALYGDAGDVPGQAHALNQLGYLRVLTGDYPAAAASHQRALALFSALGNLQGQANALNDLGIVQQETGDYPAAAASHQQALARYREFGRRLGQAEALNRLGELSSRTSATGRAREYHAQALAIARDLGAPLEEAHALEGLGQTYLQDGNPRQAATHLQHALTIYQRIGAPAARRIQENLQNHRPTSTTSEPQPAAPNSECHQPRTPAAPQEATE